MRSRPAGRATTVSDRKRTMIYDRVETNMGTTSTLEEIFGHHTWASLTLIDACLSLDIDQLQAPAIGSYGPILDTLRHLVGNEAFDLAVVEGVPSVLIDSERMTLKELRAMAERSGDGWMRVIRQPLDPAAVFLEVDPVDGFRREATLGVRLAQALHHATEHRAQICSAFTMIGLEAPRIDAFDYGKATGRISEVHPGS